jgi:hypothetical protein
MFNVNNAEDLYLANHVLSGEHYVLQRKINRYINAGIGNLSHEQTEALLGLLRQAKAELQAEQYESQFEKQKLDAEQEEVKFRKAIEALDKIFADILAQESHPHKVFEEFPERQVELRLSELHLEALHDGEIEARCDRLFGEEFTHMEVLGHGPTRVRILHFKNEDHTPAPSIYMMGNRIAVPVQDKIEHPTVERLKKLITEFGTGRVNIIYPDSCAKDMGYLQVQLGSQLELTYQALSSVHCATPWLNQVMQQAQRDIQHAIHAVFT